MSNAYDEHDTEVMIDALLKITEVLGYHNVKAWQIVKGVEKMKRDLWLYQEYADYVSSCLNLELSIDTFEKFKRTTERHIDILKTIE